MPANFAIRIRALDDERLEAFVKDWIKRRIRDYVESKRWSGTGDMGRDVVGYVTDRRHEGDWDNFQCKQLSKSLSEREAFIELGKIFMNVAAGDYSLPRSYTFVAPKGVARSVENYIAHPSRFKQAFLDKWNQACAPKLVKKQNVPMTPAIEKAIHDFSFERVYSLDAAELAEDEYAKPALVHWFDYDPGEAPRAVVPEELEDHEAAYIQQLIDLYGARSGGTLIGYEAILENPDWGQHLRDQRTKFFEAAAFDRHYRDSTPPEYLATFKDDLYHGVLETYHDDHRDGLARVLKVLTQAANVSPSGVLGRYAKTYIKQGTCHHFANEGRLPWKK